MLKQILFTTILFLGVSFGSIQAQECFIGEVRMFAGNFAPRSWAFCHGQILAINSNQALFSILGTTYGGDGRTSFGLPDLRGRVVVGPGQAPGMNNNYREGEKGGTESNTLTTTHLPTHAHQFPGFEVLPEDPEESFEKGNKSLVTVGNDSNTSVSVTNSGSQQSVNNVQPYQAINYIICLTGIFPSRN